MTIYYELHAWINAEHCFMKVAEFRSYAMACKLAKELSLGNPEVQVRTYNPVDGTYKKHAVYVFNKEVTAHQI